MPGSIRALRRRVDPIRGGGRLPLVKRRTAGRPQFRETGSDTLSVQEEAIADAVEQAVLSVPSETVLDSLESRDYAGYGRAVLSALTDASRAIEDALLDAFVASGETSAIDLGRELATQYRRVGKADGPSPSEVALRFRFNTDDPRATEWARTESSRLITNMARSEQEVFRALVGQTFDEARAPGSSASLIYRQLQTVTPSPTAAQFASTLGTNLNGLTTRYERAVVNRVADRAGDLYARGITGTKALQDLQKTGDKYATKLRRARSRTIARTERMMAHNQARLLSYQQAIDTGLMSRDHSRKVWSTGPFDVCPICVGMAGVEAKVADPFTLPNGTQVQAPPAHPNCRCTLQSRTNTNLYEPPTLLGSNQPGDPFRFGGRGFTSEGQQLAGRPLPGAAPPVAPVEEPEIIEPATPPNQRTVVGEVFDDTGMDKNGAAAFYRDSIDTPALSDEHRLFIDWYTGSGSSSINGVLRGKLDVDDEWLFREGNGHEKRAKVSEWLRRESGEADDLFEETGNIVRYTRNSDQTTGDFVRAHMDKFDDAVNATVNENVTVFRGMRGMSLDVEPGDLMRDDGFMSTSLRRDVAERFSKKGTLLRINVKAGQRVMNVGGKWESELVLPRGSSLRVVNVDRSGKQVIVDAVLEG
jgi:hypothetical protein